MNDNAISITPTGIQKIYVDFANYANIHRFLHAEKVVVIEEKKTMNLSHKLGVKIMALASEKEEGQNNSVAKKIFGVEDISSTILLCKTDESFNALPFVEENLERLYRYLTTGVLVLPKNLIGGMPFFTKYQIDSVVLPNLDYEPEAYYLEEMPEVLLLKYNLAVMSDAQLGNMGQAISAFSARLNSEGFSDVDGVKLSPDGKYFIHYVLESENYRFLVLLQATKDNESVLIKDIDMLSQKFLQE